MNAPQVKVEFVGRVREQLPETVRSLLTDELPRIFASIAAGQIATILVPRLFAGYAPDFEKKVVLAVELILTDGYERHIAKVGLCDEVAQDFDGWHDCTGGRMVASRIFAPARKIELDNNRVAVVYRDAYALFGPDDGSCAGSAPETLDDAVTWAVKDNEPDPMSAQRAISHIYTDLGVWFYRGAKEDSKCAMDFYAKRLGPGKHDQSGPTILERWRTTPSRAEMRRHAVWLLCGCDVPDADPIDKPARYLDPIDYLNWATEDGKIDRLPKTLVGCAHGDLHARNILVGVRRGEVQYPAVFDYGDMSAQNVLAWDFAKLETEIKVRRLAEMIRQPEVIKWLLKRSKLRNAAFEPAGNADPSVNARRADRLAAFLAFEECIDDLTTSIEDIHSVNRIQPLPAPGSGIEMLDRLTAIIFRIRQEAAYWLGFQAAKRSERWKDELNFALAVYGLMNVRWDYSVPEQEAALISAGVALARSTKVRQEIKSAIAAGDRSVSLQPSYRVPLAFAYADWKHPDYKAGCQFVDERVLNVTRSDANVATKIMVRDEMQHAIPLIGQALLLHLEVGDQHAVESVLERMRMEARTFHDFETLARVGRVYKDAADRKWEAEMLTDRTGSRTKSSRLPSTQMYDKSFEVYSEAYELTRDWYVGINAATLALLTGKLELAEQYASEVAATCKDKVKHDTKNRYWLFATEGEAALILNQLPDAMNFYQSAIESLSPGQSGMANSSYLQAIRLWKQFGAEGETRVGPVLELFETSDFGAFLKKGFLGRGTQ